MKVLENKPDIDLKEIDYILEYTLTAMIGIMSYWFIKEKTLARDRLFSLIHRLMEDGIMRHLPL